LKLPFSVLARAYVIRGHIDEEFYLNQLPWLRDTTADIACHYLAFGEGALVHPNATFDPKSFGDSYQQEKPNHLSWFEASLLDSGVIRRLEIHKRQALDEGGFGGITVAALLPKRDWERLKIEKNFDVRNVILPERENIDFRLVQDVSSGGEQIEALDVLFVDHILERAEGRTLSCDIWDTVLRRNCHPDETKLRAARALWLIGRQRNPSLSALRPVDLYQARRVAEADVSTPDFEFRFNDMARSWLEFLQLPSKPFLKWLCEAELMIETDATSADPTVAQLLQRFPGRKIAISDFYMGSTALTRLLKANGLPEFDEVYVSCDHMETKREGRLYDVARVLEGCAPEDILHIGDREGTDVANARDHGFAAELYYDPVHEEVAQRAGEVFDQHLAGDFSGHAAELSRIVGFVPGQAGVNVSALALAFTGFALDIIERALEVGTDKIFFFSREGSFFRELCTLATELDVFDLGAYPTGHMLYVSRRATFAASLSEFNVKNLMRLWSQYSSQSLQALATTLNIPPTLWREAAESFDLDLEEVLTYPWQHKQVQGFLKNPEVRGETRKAIWAQREDLLHYLEAAGFEPGKAVNRIIVDIGWRGTIQDNLAHLVSGKMHGCYLGLDQFLNAQPVGVSKSGYLMDVPQGRYFKIKEYAALELLSNAMGGSVIGYRDGEPVREVFSGEEAVIERTVLPLQAELLDRCRAVMLYAKRHGLVAADFRDLSQIAVSAFMASPERRVANAFNDLEHNETFGTGGVASMARGLELDNSFDAGGYEFHAFWQDKLSEIRWPDAFLHSDEFDRLNKSLSMEQRLSLPRVSGKPLSPGLIKARGNRVVVFAPRPIWGSGGHRTIYNFAKALDDAGHQVTICSEARGDAYGYLEQEIASHSIETLDTWYSGLSADAAVATINYSSVFLAENFAEKSTTFYFVQDNEAEFNMTSDEFVIGENSFAHGHMHLCVGRWLPHLIQTRFGGRAIGAGLGIDSSIYRPLAEGMPRRDQIAVLYQPDKPRRMPDHCIQALILLKRKHPEVEIVLYGSERRPDLPFDFQHWGLVNDLSALNGLYNSSKVGLCISLTNPSRIPYEMMAAGCVPVDVYRYNTLFDYAAGTGVLAYQSAESIAAALDHLLIEVDELERRRDRGIELGQKRTLQWETDVHVNALEMVLQGMTLEEPARPWASYSEAPFVATSDETLNVRSFLKWQADQAGLVRK